MRMWQTIRSAVLSRHIHEEAYAAVVLSGAYEEAGDQGRFQVEAGDVVLHDCFEAHLDRFSSSGAVVLNLRLPPRYSFTPGIAKIADVDILVHTAEISEAEAADLLLSMVQGRTPESAAGPDGRAAPLTKNQPLPLSFWAQA